MLDKASLTSEQVEVTYMLKVTQPDALLGTFLILQGVEKFLREGVFLDFSK